MSGRLARIKGKIKSFRWILQAYARPSFSQVGEDAVLAYFFINAGIAKPTYLEIGTNHPVHGNNTYAFYLRGSRGVLVEPDPAQHSLIKNFRPNDTLLPVGIALEEKSEAEFYIFPPQYAGWNTFSNEEVKVRGRDGIRHEKMIRVPLMNINTVIENNFSTPPDFIGIDVEGLDEEIIRSLDFEKHGPKAICIETIRFGGSAGFTKEQSIIEFITGKGYVLYADTYVNSIFCKKEFLHT